MRRIKRVIVSGLIGATLAAGASVSAAQVPAFADAQSSDSQDSQAVLQSDDQAISDSLEAESASTSSSDFGSDIEDTAARAPWSSGWVSDGAGWRYGLEDGSFASNRWIYSGGHWYWIDADGLMATGLLTVNDSEYLLAQDGSMQTGWSLHEGNWFYANPSGALTAGWQYVNGSWYWLDPSSHVMSTGWVNSGGAWYYMSGSGAMATGWAFVDGSWYYLNGSGAMATGWLLDGSWYYLAGSGAMATGLQEIGGTSYFFNGSGAMATGWCLDGADWRYADASGALRSGWLKLGGSWYWVDPESLKMVTGAAAIAGKSYFFADSGVMQTGWVLDGANWYLADSSGVLQSGWQYVGESWYWLDQTTLKMKTGWLKSGQKAYYLGSSGAMETSTLVREGDEAYWVGPDGYSLSGWQYTLSGRYYFQDTADDLGRYAASFGLVEIDGKHYFIDRDSGLQMNTLVTTDDGAQFFADSDGVVSIDFSVRADGVVVDAAGSPAAPNSWIHLSQGWIYVDEGSKLYKGWLDGTYYLDPDTGIMHTDWLSFDGKWYFLNASGVLVKNAWFQLGSYWYHSDSDGVMQTGWFEDAKGKKYFLAPAGFVGYPEGAMVTGTRVIDNKLCRFGDNGDLVYQSDVDGDPFANRSRDPLLANVTWYDDQVYLSAVIAKANEVSSPTDWFIACDNSLCRVVVLKWDYSSHAWTVTQCWNCNGARKTYFGAWRVEHKKICNWSDEYFGKGYNDWSTCFIEAYSDSNEGGHLRWVPGKGYEDCAAIHATGETTTGWVNSGCYGLLWDDAKYIYDNVTVGSSVYVFEYGDGRVI